MSTLAVAQFNFKHYYATIRECPIEFVRVLKSAYVDYHSTLQLIYIYFAMFIFIVSICNDKPTETDVNELCRIDHFHASLK